MVMQSDDSEPLFCVSNDLLLLTVTLTKLSVFCRKLPRFNDDSNKFNQ